ncbi:fasciclin domain-containing protein [Brevundimonas sp. SL161]|uniref:fasciclin domain-containing protein n=1 Tax=Brevundimonas sp. SL161 TaxID=2804613 RepID=UPI003CFB80C4
MKLSALAGAVSAAALLVAAPAAFADHHGGMSQSTVTVGGAAMYANKTIVENAVASPIHTTLVAAVTAAGLVETLSGPGPFTVFAPTDAAFAALPAGTVETLIQPANKATLTKILTYHVIAGRVTAADVIALIQAGGGSAAITTVSGDILTASLRGGSVILTDENGGVATVTQADVFQSNGVIHVTDAVSLPN